VDPHPATLSRAAANRVPMAYGVRMTANLPSVGAGSRVDAPAVR
jgi:hypothetical protein